MTTWGYKITQRLQVYCIIIRFSVLFWCFKYLWYIFEPLVVHDLGKRVRTDEPLSYMFMPVLTASEFVPGIIYVYQVEI